MLDFDAAQEYCSKQGYRLPTLAELTQLWAMLDGVSLSPYSPYYLYGDYGWPTSQLVRSSVAETGLYLYSGQKVSLVPSEPYYVTCVF